MFLFTLWVKGFNRIRLNIRLKVRRGVGYCLLGLLMNLLLSLPSIVSMRVAKLYDNICRRVAGMCVLSYEGFSVRSCDCEGIAVFSSIFEEEIAKILASSLGRGSVFIDIGAHVGRYSLLGSKLVGSEGFVIALEPVPETYASLRENLRSNGVANVVALPLAAWSSNNVLEILVPPGRSGSSAMVTRHFTGLGLRGRRISVKAVALDNLVKDLRISRVDLIKIDAEGAELEILRGSLDIIRKYRPAIVAEVLRENLAQVLSLLRGFGYRAVLLGGDPRVAVNFLFLAR
jgi:FkbM family methyltransferase